MSVLLPKSTSTQPNRESRAGGGCAFRSDVIELKLNACSLSDGYPTRPAFVFSLYCTSTSTELVQRRRLCNVLAVQRIGCATLLAEQSRITGPFLSSPWSGTLASPSSPVLLRKREAGSGERGLI